MDSMRPLVMSVVRLVLVVAALVAVTGGQARATDGQGSCSEATPGWNCATSSSFDGSSYCDPGMSGGCETCHHTGDTDDKCFYSSGTPHPGYVAEQYPGA